MTRMTSHLSLPLSVILNYIDPIVHYSYITEKLCKTHQNKLFGVYFLISRQLLTKINSAHPFYQLRVPMCALQKPS